MAYKVIIADDHEVVRAGLKSLVAGTNIRVIAEASTGDDAVRLTAKHKPDLVVMDVRMSKVDGLTALGRIKLDYPEIPILMFSTHDNPTYIARAVALGASGYILKSASGKTLIDAMQRASQGDALWTRDELRRVTGALATPRIKGEIEVALTQRESDVLRQLALGLTNKEIALALRISYETVKEHVQHILRKIGVTDRTQAAVWAVRKDLI
jgi:DNA-binding NarL/FixJ family response regulator